MSRISSADQRPLDSAPWTAPGVTAPLVPSVGSSKAILREQRRVLGGLRQRGQRAEPIDLVVVVGKNYRVIDDDR